MRLGLALAVVVSSVIPAPVAAQSNPLWSYHHALEGVRDQNASGVDATISGFLDAFNSLDMPRFIAYFAEDATTFHPPSGPPRTFQTRLQGRAEIQRTFQIVFDQIRERSGRTSAPYQDIRPQDLVVQPFDGFAIVSFHLGTESLRGRRTLVIRRVGSEWRIVHLHASVFSRDQK